MDFPSKPRTTSFFPLRKLKGSQPFSKKSAIYLVQLEEEDTNDGGESESDDPNGIKGVTEEFMVQLARAVKDAQMDERCCYHSSSPEDFICNCLLMKTARDKKQLNGKEGMVMVNAAQNPPKATNAIKNPQKEGSGRQRVILTDSLLKSRPISMMVWHGEHSRSEDKLGKVAWPF